MCATSSDAIHPVVNFHCDMMTVNAGLHAVQRGHRRFVDKDQALFAFLQETVGLTVDTASLVYTHHGGAGQGMGALEATPAANSTPQAARFTPVSTGPGGGGAKSNSAMSVGTLSPHPDGPGGLQGSQGMYQCLDLLGQLDPQMQPLALQRLLQLHRRVEVLEQEVRNLRAQSGVGGPPAPQELLSPAMLVAPTNAGLFTAAPSGDASKMSSGSASVQSQKRRPEDEGGSAGGAAAADEGFRPFARKRPMPLAATASNIRVGEFVVINPGDWNSGPFWVGKVLSKPPEEHGKKVELQWHHTESKQFKGLGDKWECDDVAGRKWHVSCHACKKQADDDGAACPKGCPLKDKPLPPEVMPITTCLSGSFDLTASGCIPKAVCEWVHAAQALLWAK